MVGYKTCSACTPRQGEVPPARHPQGTDWLVEWQSPIRLVLTGEPVKSLFHNLLDNIL